MTRTPTKAGQAVLEQLDAYDGVRSERAFKRPVLRRLEAQGYVTGERVTHTTVTGKPMELVFVRLTDKGRSALERGRAKA